MMICKITAPKTGVSKELPGKRRVALSPGEVREEVLTGDQIGILEAEGCIVEYAEKHQPPPEGSKKWRALYPDKAEKLDAKLNAQAAAEAKAPGLKAKAKAALKTGVDA